MEGVTEVFVTGPTLVNMPVIFFAFFAGTSGDRRSFGEALEILRIAAKAFTVLTNLGQQSWSQFRSSPRQRAKQIMVGMASEERFDSRAVERQLLFNGKEH